MKHGDAPPFFVERPAPGIEIRTEGRRTHCVRSAHQLIEVWETATLGSVFRTDGSSMTATRDEFLYHELLTHPALLRNPHPRRALILGGGDGGSAREICRYREIESIRIVELDQAVIHMAQQHLSTVHAGAFEDPRVELLIADAAAYVEQLSSTEQFDLIVFDLTGADGSEAAFYTAAFFTHCARHLTPAGSISLHLGAPLFKPASYRRVIEALRNVFSFNWQAHVHVPVYAGLRGFAIASNAALPGRIDVDTIRQQRGLSAFTYYNTASDHAQGEAPAYLNRLIP